MGDAIARLRHKVSEDETVGLAVSRVKAYVAKRGEKFVPVVGYKRTYSDMVNGSPGSDRGNDSGTNSNVAGEKKGDLTDSISVRKTTYRGQEGFQIVGKMPHPRGEVGGRGVKIFEPDEAKAREIARLLKTGDRDATNKVWGTGVNTDKGDPGTNSNVAAESKGTVEETVHARRTREGKGWARAGSKDYDAEVEEFRKMQARSPGGSTTSADLKGKSAVATMKSMIETERRAAKNRSPGAAKVAKELGIGATVGDVVDYPGRFGGMKTKSGHRALSQIAAEARHDWGTKVNYAARPYLDAMLSLDDIQDNYGADSADMIVAYFLSNARSWTGPKAKEIKAELKAILKKRR